MRSYGAVKGIFSEGDHTGESGEDLRGAADYPSGKDCSKASLRRRGKPELHEAGICESSD